MDWAMRTASYVASRQRPDGSWPYGGDDYQAWADNFHTAFILTSLSRIIEASDAEPGSTSRGSVDQLDNSLRRGLTFGANASSSATVAKVLFLIDSTRLMLIQSRCDSRRRSFTGRTHRSIAGRTVRPVG